MDAFQLFRPSSHFIAPHSWSNDPCGAVYVPETQDYLLCYQWNPGTTEGGNCAWGMARSKDLITWEDCAPPIWNGPRGSYDAKGVFSGSIVANTEIINGAEQTVLYLFYTSVSAVPIHWSKPYIEGCETQSVAISTDFGLSWRKHEANPLLRQPPHSPGATTGWRDPFVSRWAEMSRLLCLPAETWYMMISSGERGVGPQLHLYKSPDLLAWDHVCELLGGATKTEERITPTSELTWGVNFECASFSEIQGRSYLVLGVEEEDTARRHNGHHLIWLAGHLSLMTDGQTPYFKVEAHSPLDHGLLYAAHIFRDAEGRLIQLGWADEQATQAVVKAQGWAGCLGHPRELYQITKRGDGHAASDAWAVDERNGTMSTLGVRPAPQVSGLRGSLAASTVQDVCNMRSAHFELHATLERPSLQEKLVFDVRASPDFSEFTRIAVDLSAASLVVDRSKASLAGLHLPEGVSPAIDTASFSLDQGESVEVRILCDNSIVEVFVNDRAALTSRVYPTLNTSTSIRFRATVGDSDVTDKVEMKYWEVSRAAWPRRGSGPALWEELHPLRRSTAAAQKVESREMEVPIEIAA